MRVAAGNDDTLVLHHRKKGTWTCRFDASRIDAAGTAKLGVKPGAVTRRTTYYDPAWYTKDVPATDTATVEARYKDLPVNKWVRLAPPRIPKPNMHWGSAMYLPKLDKIARFSGGHSSYCGTAPHVYDPKTDRWSLPFAPEIPINFCKHEAGIPGDWSFKGRPWMPGHTWKSTGVDKAGGRLVYLGPTYTWYFDPLKKAWERSKAKHPERDVRKSTVCWTPRGTVVFNCGRRSNRTSLYLIEDSTGEWKPMPTKRKLPGASIDYLGTVYDAKRDRILILAPREKGKPGSVVAYDMKSAEVKWLEPAGREKAVAHMRELAYIPEHDMVMTLGRVKGPGGKPGWAFYDCANNKWRVCEIAGKSPLTNSLGRAKRTFWNYGLMYDSKRKLIWVLNNVSSNLDVLKFDPKTPELKDLK